MPVSSVGVAPPHTLLALSACALSLWLERRPGSSHIRADSAHTGDSEAACAWGLRGLWPTSWCSHTHTSEVPAATVTSSPGCRHAPTSFLLPGRQTGWAEGRQRPWERQVQRAPRSLPLGDARSSGSHAATWMVPRAMAHSLKSPKLGQWGSGLSRTPGGVGLCWTEPSGPLPGSPGSARGLEPAGSTPPLSRGSPVAETLRAASEAHAAHPRWPLMAPHGSCGDGRAQSPRAEWSG